MRVHCIEAREACDAVVAWAGAVTPRGAGRYVCAANVHMTMEAHDDPAYRDVVNAADLVVPDGQPMVWALRALKASQRRRVRVAPDFLLDVLANCEALGIAVGLYGGTAETLGALQRRLASSFPELRITFAYVPPFRPLTPEEDIEVVSTIRAAGVQLLLVGIGCPKQERWMADHAARLGAPAERELPCVMLGVGAAFDMLAGKTGNAPPWMQGLGLEWLYRLAQEPGRLWRRQLVHNPRFVALFLAALLRSPAREERD